MYSYVHNLQGDIVDVGLSNKLDAKGRKNLARGEPVQRAHGAVVAPTLAGS